MVRAVWNGQVIAESDSTIVVEGDHYFPVDSVRHEFLQPSDHHTTSDWKGKASYRSVVVGGKTNRDAAWFYPAALPAASNIEGRVAFWRGVTIEDTDRAPRRTLRSRLFKPAEPAGHAGVTVLSPVVELETEAFAGSITGHTTIVDFWAPWCAPCRAFHPTFDEAATEHASDELWFARTNVDTNPDIAAKLNIMSIPTVVVFDAHGIEIDRHVGVPDRRRFAQLIANAQLAPKGVA